LLFEIQGSFLTHQGRYLPNIGYNLQFQVIETFLSQRTSSFKLLQNSKIQEPQIFKELTGFRKESGWNWQFLLLSYSVFENSQGRVNVPNPYWKILSSKKIELPKTPKLFWVASKHQKKFPS